MIDDATPFTRLGGSVTLEASFSPELLELFYGGRTSAQPARGPHHAESPSEFMLTPRSRDRG